MSLWRDLRTIKALKSPLFCGQTGPRTFFMISLTQGQARDITRYSMVPGEDEVLLPPGCRFRVSSVLEQGELTIIQIEELPSSAWIIDLRTMHSGASNAGGPAPPAAAAAPPKALAQKKLDVALVERRRQARGCALLRPPL